MTLTSRLSDHRPSGLHQHRPEAKRAKSSRKRQWEAASAGMWPQMLTQQRPGSAGGPTSALLPVSAAKQKGLVFSAPSAASNTSRHRDSQKRQGNNCKWHVAANSWTFTTCDGTPYQQQRAPSDRDIRFRPWHPSRHWLHKPANSKASTQGSPKKGEAAVLCGMWRQAHGPSQHVMGLHISSRALLNMGTNT